MRFFKTRQGRRVAIAAVWIVFFAIVWLFALTIQPQWLGLHPAQWGWLRVGPMTLTFGDVISLAGLLATLAVLILSVGPNVLELAETSRSAHYSQLDAMYLEILKMAVDKPYLRRPEKLPPERRQEYDSYAFIVWNFLETVRDRCEDDQTLKDIWAPVIATEHELHRAWFYAETTPYWEKEAPKFRLPFAHFIWRHFGSPTAPVCGNVLHTESSRWISESWELWDVDRIKSHEATRQYLGEPSEHVVATVGARAAAEAAALKNP
ncbi:MAG TPA: hypothetical protein VF782_03720 [Allosphingosinicella sp.]|jgi:hypothetical protein